MAIPESIAFSEEDKQKLKDFRSWTMGLAKERGVLFSNFLHTLWEKFYSSVYHEKNLSMNYIVLARVVESFWEDILRIETYHDVNPSDRHKLAAYLFKWLSRMQPITPTISFENLEKELSFEILQANALFAMACALSFLKCSDFSEDEKDYIIYSSMYRDIHAAEWTMIFYLLETLHSEVTS